MQSFFQRHRVLLLHLSFWCAYLSFFIYQFSSFRHREREVEMLEVFTQAGFHVAFNMAVAYFNYFIVLPRFLKHKKTGRYLLEFFIPFAILTFGRVHLQRYLADGYTHKAGYLYSTTFVVQVAATSLFVVIFVAMLRFLQEWFEFESRKKAVENEKLISELNFLKEQINPHFLFNTLNNLYYLAYSQSPNTTEVIAKLSQMMRYMIYETNHADVPLMKEIEYMENYISLERLRLNGQIPIGFEVHGDVQNVRITPLIFITFLENAFKHGIGASPGDAWIKVSIRVSGNECTYTVENSNHAVTASEHGKSGIGLQNVQRRLALSYPGRHTLTTEKSADRYTLTLKITLA
ncbi:histidine kinase [Fulvivirgaceae bacterium PWU5]|uniref:Histidine kinase n=1 Tax=Dawidia cretensis TaxID=2782350 RepID=A0AAP2DUI5_9BACT|nr:histidine kinase [Dawidia cretensis]MBT1707695.1 histidine kinase [Dawidia cretensis]